MMFLCVVCSTLEASACDPATREQLEKELEDRDRLIQVRNSRGLCTIVAHRPCSASARLDPSRSSGDGGKKSIGSLLFNGVHV